MGDFPRAFLIANLALFMAFCWHAGKWSEQPLLAEAPAAATPIGGPDPQQDDLAPLPTVSLKDMITFLTKANAVFIDARPAASYVQGHIVTAINIPINQPIPEYYRKTILSAQRVIVYCSGPDCSDAKTVGNALKVEGANNVAVFEGGFPEWQKAGLPVMIPKK